VLRDNKRCNKYTGNYSQYCHGKAAFYKKQNLSTNKLDLKLRKKLVECHILGVPRCGAETLDTSGRSEIRTSKVLQCDAGKGWMGWTDRVRKEEVLHRGEEARNILNTINGRNGSWVGHTLSRNCLLKRVIEGKIEGRKDE
jgi:hypothetical protein